MATIYAASHSLADVNAAIASAANLDTVVVPAGDGSETWASKLTITKGINLIGPGYGNLSISISHADNVLQYDPANLAADYPFRVSGFHFNCTGGNGIYLHTTGNTPQTKIRIDHNRFTGATEPIFTYGNFWGVVDNNSLEGMTVQRILQSTMMGIWNWTNLTYNFGTANALYFEDNTVTTTDSFVGACGFGTRYCVRYNTFTAIGGDVHSFLDIHGNQASQGHNGGMGIEVYNNTFNTGACNGGPFWDYRGGRGLFYNNTCTGTGSLVPYMREEYLDNLYSGPPVYQPAFALSSSPDINADHGQPLHISGAYMFLNRHNGSNMPFTVTATVDYSGQTDDYKCFAAEAAVPTADLHFWQEQASFDGSSGVGVGALGDRPESCTCNGAGWWDTDNEVLYRWKTGTGWELFYTPYEYPHPLRAANPTGFIHTQGISLTISDNEVAKLWVDIPKKRAVVGTDVIYTVHAEPFDGFTGDITLDITGLPTNATDSYGTNPISETGTTTATVTTTDVAAGTYDMNITGTSAGGDVASVRVILEVVEAADADIKVPIRRVRAKKGDNAVFTIFAEACGGYTGDVDLSVSGTPTGATAVFGDDSIAYNGSTTLTVDTGTADAGTYDLIITGEGPA